jgi:uncharacterized FlaG/YvyC family protein
MDDEERKQSERVLEATHEVYKERIATLEADYKRELNAKLDQINAQARTIMELQLQIADKLATMVCPICDHQTKHHVDAQVVKCSNCLRSFQLEPEKHLA